MASNKYFVTTSIPYVNGVAHVGHAMEFIQADALARYQRLRGKEVIFSTGTDEHGGKNAEAAAAKNLTPKQYVDELSQNFKDLATVLNVSYDRFIRTTDKNHEKTAKVIWKQLKPYIYKGKYQGMYDQKEEEFITAEKAKVIKQEDPKRYAKLQTIEEENYFFKLSEFTGPIRQAIENGSFRVVPTSRKHEILSVLEQGLDDISISRPKDKIGWGISVPDDKDHVIYVWFEALMNYVTVLDYPDGQDFKLYWPADVQVVGKDILRFHAAIWPGMLLALGLPLPKALYVHGFVTLNGEVMSKSTGVVVSPLEIVNTYGSDAMRYYFLRHIPSYSDGDFSWEKMDQAYHNELGNSLGNLVQRVSGMINRYQDGAIGDIPEAEHDREPYDAALADFRFDKALDYTFNLIHGLNQYIDETKPWEIAKRGEPEHLREVLAYTVSSILQIAQLLAPFLPDTSQRIFDTFKEGVVQSETGQLFPRIEDASD